MMNKNKKQKGFLILASLLVVGAISVTVVISFLVSGVNQAQSSFTVEQSKQAQALAGACAEQALMEIKNSASFEGSDNLTFDQGTCSYTVEKIDENYRRRISATGTVGSIVSKLKIVTSNITPNISIASWKEVADFED